MVSEANVATSEANEMDDELTLMETLSVTSNPEEGTKTEEDWETKYKQAEANRLALQKNLSSMQDKLRVLEGDRIPKAELAALQEEIREQRALIQDMVEISLRGSEEFIEPEPVKQSRTPHYDAFKAEKDKKKEDGQKKLDDQTQEEMNRQTLYEMVVGAGIDPNDERLYKEVIGLSPNFKGAILKFPKYVARLKEEEMAAKKKKEMEESGLLEVSTGSASGAVTRLNAQQRRMAREFGLSDEEYAAGLTMETATKPIKGGK